MSGHPHNISSSYLDSSHLFRNQFNSERDSRRCFEHLGDIMAPIPKNMRAIVCATPGPSSVLQIQNQPVPSPKPGEVLIQVLGFGINRAEMFTRQGHSPGIEFPRVIGIECIGRVAAYGPPLAATKPKKFIIGQRVATCMGGLGREIPGSYQEYTCAVEENLRAIPDTKNLSVGQIAALPEMFQTTWGALTEGLDVQQGESVLVRGATSSIGLCALQFLKVKLGAGRLGATTRNAEREGMLKDAGADEVFVDDGSIAGQFAKSKLGKFDKCLELVGTTTILDSAACLNAKGTVCMTGIQGGQWELRNFNPMAIPNRVRLCGYGGGPSDFHAMPWEELVRDVDEGRISIPVEEYKMEDIKKIHDIMEKGGGGAKMAVVVANH
ncbi:hypothetical protein N0V93_008062 [Gnomoniopsis smithogilvyi]|uniref:Enoyl reductase (ER) domain-containing protein n=1 Tax=Gnomoniopsis smithogilvyi TaxID=1191159 RepID=A0A9W8YL06_9PEZI|nr:hypothetical protein N0V93_008062 [Gnomoniopsis smithogilvyi]